MKISIVDCRSSTRSDIFALLPFDLSEVIMRGVKKENLPTKICVVCQRPFAWRKKWARVWDEVKYCSDACRAKRSQ